jgi:hypothetical protein
MAYRGTAGNDEANPERSLAIIPWQSAVDGGGDEVQEKREAVAGVESVGHIRICIKSWRACTNRAAKKVFSASQWCNLRAHRRGYYDAERSRIANSIRHLSMW